MIRIMGLKKDDEIKIRDNIIGYLLKNYPFMPFAVESNINHIDYDGR